MPITPDEAEAGLSPEDHETAYRIYADAIDRRLMTGGRSYVLRYQHWPNEPMVDRLIRHDADCDDPSCGSCA